MKKLIVLLLFFLPLAASGQPEINEVQQQWVDSVKHGRSVEVFDWAGGYLMYADYEAITPAGRQRLLNSKGFSTLRSYEKLAKFKHDERRYLTVGELRQQAARLFLVTGWRFTENENWKKELDILLSLRESDQEINASITSVLNKKRSEWVKLANQHNPEAHIKEFYASDVVYFGNGRRSDGHKSIAGRYVYMENPNYQVDLEKEQLWKISDEKVLEVGRYFTGPVKRGTGGLYLILWEKQESGDWKIALDFNF